MARQAAWLRSSGAFASTVALYVLGGWLSLLLAVPPDSILVLWLPAGIALWALLSQGAWLWTAVATGTLLLGAPWWWSPPAGLDRLQMGGMAVGLAAAAALQAWLAAHWVRRRVDFAAVAVRERELGTFLLLAGPAAGAVGSGLSTAVLLATGCIGWADAPSLASLWLVAQVTGVLLVGPVLVAFRHGRDGERWRRVTTVAVPMVAALGLAIGLFAEVRANDREQQLDAFRGDAEALALRVSLGITQTVATVRMVALRFQSAPMGTGIFQRFLQPVLQAHPELAAVQWVPRVARSALPELTASLQAERPKFEVFRFGADGRREPVTGDWIWPLVWSASTAPDRGLLGLDLGSEPGRAAALQAAFADDTPVATSFVACLADTGGAQACLVAVPVQDARGAPGGPVGCVLGVLHPTDLLQHLVPAEVRRGLAVGLYDAMDGVVARLRPSPAADAPLEDAWLRQEIALPMPGRDWRLVVTPTHAYAVLTVRAHAWILLGGGVLFCSLLGVFLLMVTGRATAIEELVAARTAELQQANTGLAHANAGHQKAEALLRGSLQEKEVLLQEVHHRVKNNLQLVTSLLNLQAAQTRDEGLQAMLRDSQHRVRAMAQIHEILYRAEDLARIRVDEQVRELVAWLLRSHGAEDGRIRIGLDVQPVALGLDQAVPLGLLLNELVQNALKHAFVGRQRGVLQVGVQRRHDALEVVVADDGIGLPAGLEPERCTSLGLRLVVTLARQLGGSLRLEPAAGARFVVVFPCTAVEVSG